MSAKASKKAPPKAAPLDNYLAYDRLTDDEWQRFSSAHLHLYLQDAFKRLFPKRDSSKKLLSGPPYKAADLKYINARIQYALELIGQYSNERFGNTAAEQHDFFKRRGEQETFFTHLFRAIQMHKRAVLSGKNPAAKSTGIINNGHLQIEALRNGEDIFPKIGKAPIKENDLYAAGIFYTINFAFDAVQSNDTTRLCRLLASMFHFGSGTSYEVSHGQQGGKHSGVKRNEKKEKAYKVFLSLNLCEIPRQTNEAMMADLMPHLRKKRIPVTAATVLTKWVPEFVRRYKQSIQNNR